MKYKTREEFEQEIPGLATEEFERLKADIAANGVREPLTVTTDGTVLDGHNRLRIVNEIPEVDRLKLEEETGRPIIPEPVVRDDLVTDAQCSAFIIRININRRQMSGEQINTIRERQKKIAIHLNKVEHKSQTEIQRLIGVPQCTISKWLNAEDVSDIHVNKANIEPHDGRVSIPKRERESIYERAEAGESHQSIADDYKAGRSRITQIVGKERSKKKGAESHDDHDRRIFAELGIKIQPYDFWQFHNCDERFGAKYPGRIPGQMVAHCLYFWTKPGDLVVDPMAGSGTTIDVCKRFNREVLGFDARPSRDDIHEHKLSAGWPQRTAGASLIFWDPPYYKKVDEGYSDDSISRLDRDGYLQSFTDAASGIPDGFKGVLALLVSDYNDEQNAEENIFYWEYVRIFEDAGWTPVRRIQTPLGTQQVHPDIVNKFRASRRLARLNRDLVVFTR